MANGLRKLIKDDPDFLEKKRIEKVGDINNIEKIENNLNEEMELLKKTIEIKEKISKYLKNKKFVFEVILETTNGKKVIRRGDYGETLYDVFKKTQKEVKNNYLNDKYNIEFFYIVFPNRKRIQIGS
jgi:hypothetical protein